MVYHDHVDNHIFMETLEHIQRAMQNKRHWMLSCRILFFMTMSGHTLASDGTEWFCSKIFNRPPYSPNLAIIDYFLFLQLKFWLASQKFYNDNELMALLIDLSYCCQTLLKRVWRTFKNVLKSKATMSKIFELIYSWWNYL